MVWLSSILFGPTKTLSPQIDEKTREKMEKWVLDKIGPAASHVFLSLFFFFLLFSLFRCPFIIYLFIFVFFVYIFFTHHLLFFFFSILSFFFLYFFLFIFFMFWCSSFIFSKDFILFIFWERNFGFLNFLCFIKKNDLN